MCVLVYVSTWASITPTHRGKKSCTEFSNTLHKFRVTSWHRLALLEVLQAYTTVRDSIVLFFIYSNWFTQFIM